MSIEVEVNLRVPSMTIRSGEQSGKRINNASVRFRKVIQVATIPKPGDLLELPTSGGTAFNAAVTRAAWDEERARFMLDCRYAHPSMRTDDYTAIINDPTWRKKDLLEE